jgi:hypothetical protein
VENSGFRRVTGRKSQVQAEMFYAQGLPEQRGIEPQGFEKIRGFKETAGKTAQPVPQCTGYTSVKAQIAKPGVRARMIVSPYIHGKRGGA